MQINKWYLDGRHPETGEYPTFPPEEVGGSKVILRPPAEPVDAPAEPPPPEKPTKGGKAAPPGKKEAAKKPDAKAGKGKGDKAQEPPGEATTETLHKYINCMPVYKLSRNPSASRKIPPTAQIQ